MDIVKVDPEKKETTRSDVTWSSEKKAFWKCIFKCFKLCKPKKTDTD